MGVEVAAAGCFQWSSSQTIIPQSHPPLAQTIPSTKRRVALFGPSPTLRRTRSNPPLTISRASFDHAFSEEYSSNQNQSTNKNNDNTEQESPLLEFSFPEEPPWTEDIVTERKANSVGLPFSLRVIKKKMQWEEGFREASESAYCSMKKAFSSMVFIIRELHSYSFQLREVLFSKDLQGIIDRVHKEVHESFLWLFKQVFSHTPTLMVYVMILLANFMVFSMASNVALAAELPLVAVVCDSEIEMDKFDSSSLKSFSVSSTIGKSTSIGGGGGGKLRPVSSGTEDDGHSNRSDRNFSQSVSGDEENLWDSISEEASRMQASLRGESLMEKETVERFVSPVNAKIEPEDYSDYLGTEMLYQLELSEDPNNALLLANYAQFLYLVSRDYDRAEEYFKKAIGVEPKDAEAYNKYASFLWKARNDLWAAEETFLEAINVEPTNSSYAANYAHFLWNTGGDDTCFPIPCPDASQEA